MRDKLTLAIGKHKTDWMCDTAIFAVLRYMTTSGLDKFVGPRAFKDQFGKLTR